MQRFLKYTIGFFFLIPILILLAPSFYFSDSYFIPIKLFTEYTLNTLYLVIGVGLLTLLFGVGSACVVTFLSFPGKSILKYLLFLPLAVPAYISAFTYIRTFEFSGPVFMFLRENLNIFCFYKIHSIWGAIFIMSLSLYPYIYILTLTRLGSIGNFVAISRTCGKSFFKTMIQVVIPLSRPSIIAGLALTLMEVVAEFGLTQVFGIPTLTTGIYRAWFLLHNNVWAARLIFILLFFSVFLIFLEKKSRQNLKYYNILNSNLTLTWKLSEKNSILVFCIVFLLPLLGFFFPVIMLLIMAFKANFDYQIIYLISNSIIIALIASFITISLGLLIVYLNKKEKTQSVILQLSTFGYAIPGIIVAMGIMNFLGILSTQFNNTLESIFSINLDIAFIGTFFALLYSYSFRFLSLSTNTLQAGFDRIPKELEWNLKLMGKNSFFDSFNTFFPMLVRSFCSGFILIFVDTIKELPATLIVRPFNFETMSTRVYELIMDERYYDAAVPSLVITGVGLCSIIFLMKFLYSSNLHKKRKSDKFNCLCEVCLSTRNECYN